jgi:hypothetical protein
MHNTAAEAVVCACSKPTKSYTGTLSMLLMSAYEVRRLMVSAQHACDWWTKPILAYKHIVRVIAFTTTTVPVYVQLDVCKLT